jgi:hypothetical protein
MSGTPVGARHNAQTEELEHPTRDDPKAAVTTRRAVLSGIKESSDDYPALVEFDGMRVITCRDDLQWILQRRMPSRWHDLGYFRNRDVLIERSGASGEALRVLQQLPKMHERSGGA